MFVELYEIRVLTRSVHIAMFTLAITARCRRLNDVLRKGEYSACIGWIIAIISYGGEVS